MLIKNDQSGGNGYWDYAGDGYTYPFLSQYFLPDAPPVEEQTTKPDVSKTSQTFCSLCPEKALLIDEGVGICDRHEKYLSTFRAEVGDKMRQSRVDVHFTQSVLGQITGINDRYISACESGKKYIFISRLKKIADAVKRPLQYYFE